MAKAKSLKTEKDDLASRVKELEAVVGNLEEKIEKLLRQLIDAGIRLPS